MKSIVDTNILIRFLTNDTPTQAKAVELLLKNARKHSIYLSDVIIVETVFVLLSVYELSKEEIIEKIGSIISYDKFKLDRILFQEILTIYSTSLISFVDAYLASLVVLNRYSPLYTFDKKLLSRSDIAAEQPV